MNTRKLCVTKMVLLFAIIVLLITAVPLAISFSAENDCISIENNGSYIREEKLSGNSKTITLDKSLMRSATGSEMNFAEAIGMDQHDYDAMSQEYKDDLAGAKSIIIQEFYSDDKFAAEYKDINVNHLSDNGYIRTRYTVIDTGEIDSHGDKILTIKADFTWEKLPMRRRKDVFAVSYQDRFIQYRQPTAYMNWDYTISGQNMQPGMTPSGVQSGWQRQDDIWNSFLDGEFYMKAQGNRYVVTTDLPNSGNFYQPSGKIRLGFSIDVVDTGSGGFNIWSNLAHDQGVFAANKPSVSFGNKLISITASGLVDVKEYNYCSNALYL